MVAVTSVECGLGLRRPWTLLRVHDLDGLTFQQTVAVAGRSLSKLEAPTRRAACSPGGALDLIRGE